MKRKFGRDVAKDPRDKDYSITVGNRKRQSKNWNDKGWHGDQGSRPSCVGYGWAHWLHCSPVREFVQPDGLYEIAQYFDEWEGIDYEGTSVRAGAKVLAMLGAIGQYRWAWDAEDIATHVLNNGPVVLGTDWYDGMDIPNRAGVMSIDGDLLGGHCYLAVGYNSRNELFRIKNSWGTNWGNNGYAYLSVTDLQTLMDADGEACIGTETKLKP